MLKKLFKIIRFTFIGIVWSCLFLIFTNNLIFHVWNFNFMSAHSWQTIIRFWNSGGVIKSSADYLFLTVLFSLPFIWIFGWRYLLKRNYLELLLYPINSYNRYVIKKYGQSSKRIVLRNIKSSQKMIEEIKTQLESIKPEKNKEVTSIRGSVNQKIQELNKK